MEKNLTCNYRTNIYDAIMFQCISCSMAGGMFALALFMTTSSSIIIVSTAMPTPQTTPTTTPTITPTGAEPSLLPAVIVTSSVLNGVDVLSFDSKFVVIEL